MDLLTSIRQKAKEINGRVVLPEGNEPRTIQAAEIITREKIAQVVLIGNETVISEIAEKANICLKGIEIIDPEKSTQLDELAEHLFERRQHKGMTMQLARKAAQDPLYFGALLLSMNKVTGGVAGALNTTGDVIKAGLHCIGMTPGTSVVSSDFLMIMPDNRIFSFADCAIVPQPDSRQLASIAASTAATHKALTGEEPRVAMLSFSTRGSASHENVKKVSQATTILKDLNPDLICDGEIQFDAAIVPAINAKKAPGSPLEGKANVFIFPDLGAANIGYKITQRLAGAEAVGPVVQGLAEPWFDLSRGCSVDDIVNVAAIAMLMAK